jgi:hypothetical protein
MSDKPKKVAMKTIDIMTVAFRGFLAGDARSREAK